MEASKLKLAMVSSDTRCGYMTALMGDAWNMYYWLYLFRGYHYSYEAVKDTPWELNKYDVVMLSGNPHNFQDIVNIAQSIKAVTIFYPEGDISLYHDYAIQQTHFMATAIEACDACTVMGVQEENTVAYYKSLLKSKVFFLHVPTPDDIVEGALFRKREYKYDDILIYADIKPTNPLVALGVAKKLGKPVRITGIDEQHVNFIRNYLGIPVTDFKEATVEQITYFLQWVAPSRIMIYPTRWIGSSRQTISGAVCGTPVIGNHDSHTQQRLFPMLGTYIYDMDKMCEVAEKLYTDNKFYDECCAYAMHEALFYGATNSIKRLLEIYETVKK